MKFSIIIPAYNSAGYIRKALDSIRIQSFTDYELIVVCDSCTDDTRAIAEEYGAKVEEVDCHCDGGTRNRGLDIAQGEWILFMDDDDWWLHEYVLEQLAGLLDKYGDRIDILCFSFIFRGRGYASPTGNGGYHWYAVWNKCWRRTVIGDTRFQNVKATSDVGFTDAILAKHPRMFDWDMPLYYYNYMRPGSQTYMLKE